MANTHQLQWSLRTGLHWAARRGHTAIVDLLLRAGFDPKAKSKQGKTPIEVAIEPSVKAILEQYSQSASDATMEVNSASSGSPVKERNNNNMEKGDVQPSLGWTNAKEIFSSKEARTNSLDFTSPYSPGSPTTPTRKQELYSYGRRDSSDRTRFLLVRTSFRDGKETFRRITLPGGGTVDYLKLTIERAMKMGKVTQVSLLPDHIPIETEEQIRRLADCQKVEVVFEPNGDVKDAKMNRKGSLTEKTYSETRPVKRRAARVQKTVSMNEEYMANAGDDSHRSNSLHDTSATLAEQFEVEAEHRAKTVSSQSSTHISEAESTPSNPPCAEIATREVASSRSSESAIIPDSGSVEVFQNGGAHESSKQRVEESICLEIALADKRSHNQDAHLTMMSVSSISVDDMRVKCLPKQESADVRVDICTSKNGKTQKVIGALVGDENDPYRPVKIALLVASIMGVSGGIAYYLFVRVKGSPQIVYR